MCFSVRLKYLSPRRSGMKFQLHTRVRDHAIRCQSARFVVCHESTTWTSKVETSIDATTLPAWCELDSMIHHSFVRKPRRKSNNEELIIILETGKLPNPENAEVGWFSWLYQVKTSIMVIPCEKRGRNILV